MSDTQQAEAIEAAAESSNGVEPAHGDRATDDSTVEEPGLDVPAVDDGSAFLADLAKAMQTTASAERERTLEATEQRRQAEVDRIRAREVVEADRMRSLAEEDRTAIDAWADGEVARIEEERARRGLALDADLAASLEEHRIRIAAEIDEIEARIAAYRTDVDAYFERFDGEPDDVATDSAPSGDIADVAAATAAAEPEPATAATPTLVAVMDPEASSDAVDPALAAAAASGPFESEPEVSVLAEEPAKAPTGLLQAVPALRPSTSWLRRDKD
jgi:hypothetical protein